MLHCSRSPAPLVRQVLILGLVLAFFAPALAKPAHAATIVYFRDDATGGGCTTVGMWDAVLKTCTLAADTTDVQFVIQGHGITLDGAGHAMTTTAWVDAVFADNYNGVTVRNLIVDGFRNGIRYQSVIGGAIMGVHVRNTYAGIMLNGCQGIRVEGNTVEGGYNPIAIASGSDNIVRGNTVSGGYNNISDSYGGNVTTRTLIADNTVTVPSAGCTGISAGGIDCTITGNVVSRAIPPGNTCPGIYLGTPGNGFVVTGNTVRNHWNGISVFRAVLSAQIYHNNFIDNTYHVNTENINAAVVFNLPLPVGGNYWSGWTSPDANGDGIVDNPYHGWRTAVDAFPWTTPDGWLADTTSPITTHDTPAAWANAVFAVHLACTDNPGGGGCAETRFRLDGGAWQVGTSVPINIEGDHLLEFYSVDARGNSEALQSVHARLDLTPPVINASRTPSANAAGWNNSAVMVQFACEDTLSGLAPGSPPVNIVLTAEGAGQTATGACRDLAGNLASVGVSAINIDLTPPVVSAAPDRAPNANGWYNASFTVSWQAVDRSFLLPKIYF